MPALNTRLTYPAHLKNSLTKGMLSEQNLTAMRGNQGTKGEELNKGGQWFCVMPSSDGLWHSRVSIINNNIPCVKNM